MPPIPPSSTCLFGFFSHFCSLCVSYHCAYFSSLNAAPFGFMWGKWPKGRHNRVWRGEGGGGVARQLRHLLYGLPFSLPLLLAVGAFCCATFLIWVLGALTFTGNRQTSIINLQQTKRRLIKWSVERAPPFCSLYPNPLTSSSTTLSHSSRHWKAAFDQRQRQRESAAGSLCVCLGEGGGIQGRRGEGGSVILDVCRC